MAEVTLPPGCYGIEMGDGTKYDANRQGRVTVSDEHAPYIKSSQNGQLGIVSPRGLTFGTKKGRRCAPCARLWNAWSTTCPRCGQETEDE